jgi:hypothetical protein
MSAPFNLNWGASVYAKIVATNVYGSSTESAAGNGAVLITYPDCPVNFGEDITLRTNTSVTFTW